jgi:hypothetical protein
MSCEIFHIPGTGNNWDQFEEASLVKKKDTDASKETLEKIKNSDIQKKASREAISIAELLAA